MNFKVTVEVEKLKGETGEAEDTVFINKMFDRRVEVIEFQVDEKVAALKEETNQRYFHNFNPDVDGTLAKALYDYVLDLTIEVKNWKQYFYSSRSNAVIDKDSLLNDEKYTSNVSSKTLWEPHIKLPGEGIPAFDQDFNFVSVIDAIIPIKGEMRYFTNVGVKQGDNTRPNTGKNIRAHILGETTGIGFVIGASKVLGTTAGELKVGPLKEKHYVGIYDTRGGVGVNYSAGATMTFGKGIRYKLNTVKEEYIVKEKGSVEIDTSSLIGLLTGLPVGPKFSMDDKGNLNIGMNIFGFKLDYEVSKKMNAKKSNSALGDVIIVKRIPIFTVNKKYKLTNITLGDQGATITAGKWLNEKFANPINTFYKNKFYSAQLVLNMISNIHVEDEKQSSLQLRSKLTVENFHGYKKEKTGGLDFDWD